MQTNFKEEILNVLERNNKTIEEVLYVNFNTNNSCTIEELLVMADVNYDAGYGGVEIDKSITLVGENWFLERYDYDGSECFKYYEFPTQNLIHKAITLDDISARKQ